MDKATDRGGEKAGDAKDKTSKRRRGSTLDRLTIDATTVVRANAPAGSRHKGYEEIVVQDLALNPTVTCYRRERWQTPDGETILADLDPGIIGGYGPNLHRLRADRGASQWRGRIDFEAASGALDAVEASSPSSPAGASGEAPSSPSPTSRIRYIREYNEEANFVCIKPYPRQTSAA
jgi:hypothetical protein